MSDVARLVADLYEVAGALRTAGETIAAAHGQTQARWQVLSVVSLPPMTVASAARRLGVTRQNVQKIANDLVRDGLAEWRPNPDHRTSHLLALTPAGEQTLAKIASEAAAFHHRIAASLTDREVKAARAFARKLLDGLHEFEHDSS